MFSIYYFHPNHGDGHFGGLMKKKSLYNLVIITAITLGSFWSTAGRSLPAPSFTTGGADLVISNVSLNPAAPLPGEAFDVTFTVTNQGDQTTEAVVNFDVFIDTDPSDYIVSIEEYEGCIDEALRDSMESEGLYEWIPDDLTQLDPGQSSTNTVSFPNGVGNGYHSVYAYTDAACLNAEDNEFNTGETNNGYAPMIINNSSDADIDLSIGGNSKEVFTVLQGTKELKTYAGFSGGPVLIDSTNDIPVVSSLRLLYNNKTFSELMGVPTSQLSNDYWLPYYANISGTDTQIRFTNTDPTLSTTVNVYLGDNPTPVYTNTLLPETADRFNLPLGTMGGPVHIVGTGGVNILAGMRVIYGGNKSFDELMAYPTAQLGTEYWFPFYNHNNVNLDTQVRVANTSSTDSAPVEIYIGDTLMDTTTIAPLSVYLKSFPGVNGGPVRVVSTSVAPVIPIVASLRLLYNNKTFSELMGVPTSQLSNDYWLPYYANISGTDTQLRFTNTSDTLSTTVRIYLGGNTTALYTKVLAPSSADRINLSLGTTGGPVHIVGSPNVDILAGMRVIYGGTSSFDELMAYPNAFLSSEYWFPFYNHNNVNLNTEARIATP
jgi:hypothetical protein